MKNDTKGGNDDDVVHPYLLGSSAYAHVIGDYVAAHC